MRLYPKCKDKLQGLALLTKTPLMHPFSCIIGLVTEWLFIEVPQEFFETEVGSCACLRCPRTMSRANVPNRAWLASRGNHMEYVTILPLAVRGTCAKTPRIIIRGLRPDTVRTSAFVSSLSTSTAVLFTSSQNAETLSLRVFFSQCHSLTYPVCTLHCHLLPSVRLHVPPGDVVHTATRTTRCCCTVEK